MANTNSAAPVRVAPCNSADTQPAACASAQINGAAAPGYSADYHRLLVPYKNGVICDAFIEELVDTVFGGLEPRGARAI